MTKNILFSAVFFLFPFSTQASDFVFKPLIIGGEEVKANDPVAQSTVLINGKVLRSSFTCTGTIIADDLIITAGHCLGAYRWAELTVYFRLRKEGTGPIMKVLGATRIQDDFPKTPTDWNDLALVRLAGKIPEGYRPAKILDDASLVKDGAKVLLAGYGINVPKPPNNGNGGLGVLRKVEQVVLNANYGKSEVLVDIRGKGSCSGDSGGPAFIQRGEELLLFGATSRMTSNDIVGRDPRGNPEYACVNDIVYTNILGYLDWIAQATEELRKLK